MTYLIRVLLPDSPGSLGKLAEAIGKVGGNITSVDVVETFPDGTVMDDIVVTLPGGVMADALITAAHEVLGVEVDSIRPFAGTVDRRGQIKLLSEVAGSSTQSKNLAELIERMPQLMTSTWAILLQADQASHWITASTAAPEDDGTSPEFALSGPRMLNEEDDPWLPQSWTLLDSSVAAAPLGETGVVLVLGRVGGPDFLPSEVQHLGHLGTILSHLLRL